MASRSACRGRRSGLPTPPGPTPTWRRFLPASTATEPQPETVVMGEREQRLEAAGYPLDRGPKEGPVIDLLSVLGDTVYASGQVPYDAGVLTSKGKVPSEVSVENATKAAALCAANILRAIVLKLGSLEKVERVVRVTGYVNADPDFTDCHVVINGATSLLKDV